MTELKGREPGMYFNLDNDDYHDDPALSHSGMTKVLVSWPDYWLNSCHNPERKKVKRTDAMEFGERSGMLLTQPKVFHQKYNTHGRSLPTAKGTWLSSIEWQRLNESVDAIKEVEIGRTHFRDGYAEVAIFWDDPATGIRLRAKYDFLRTFGCIDAKRIKALDDWTIGTAIRDQGLDIQHYLYLDGIKAARKWLKAMSAPELEVFAKREGVALDWLIAFRDDEDLLFRFLFQRSTPPYIWDFVDLDDDAIIEGGNSVLAALQRYKENVARYGFSKPPLGRDRVRRIGSFFIPRRRYQYED